MGTIIYWFRQDLRLEDNPGLVTAYASAQRVVLVYVFPGRELERTRWGFVRAGLQRRQFRAQAVAELAQAIARSGGHLHIVTGDAPSVLIALARQNSAERLICETIAAPEEQAELDLIRQAGIEVQDVWQSSLLDPLDLPFAISALPVVFTSFRQAVEKAGTAPHAPLAVPTQLTPLAGHAQAHLARYFASAAPQHYKATRNALQGVDQSTGLSPWLAVGALSPRTVYQSLRAHEAQQGANESTYWIWFELLWRDYFRFSQLRYGKRLFRAGGLRDVGPPAHAAEPFDRWTDGRTGQRFVDAGMRELAATGFLSNRMRQVVASFLVHDLSGDWRAGAAWFESRLIDYDVYSNHGNWLYIAGLGPDPRQGRRFDPERQAEFYDPDGAYRARWQP